MALEAYLSTGAVFRWVPDHNKTTVAPTLFALSARGCGKNIKFALHTEWRFIIIYPARSF